MAGKISTLCAVVLFVFTAGAALALDEDTVRRIKRADDVKELTELAEDIADSAVLPSRDGKPVPTAEEVGVYLQLIKVRSDYMTEVKMEKWHKEILTALGKK